MTPEERAIKALFQHRDFPIAENARGERDCYAISLPTLIRTIEAAERDTIERAAAIAERHANDAITIDALIATSIASAIRGHG